MSTEQPLANMNGTPAVPPAPADTGDTGEFNRALMRSKITISHEQGKLDIDLGLVDRNLWQRHQMITALRKILADNPESQIVRSIVDGVFEGAGVTEQD